MLRLGEKGKGGGGRGDAEDMNTKKEDDTRESDKRKVIYCTLSIHITHLHLEPVFNYSM